MNGRRTIFNHLVAPLAGGVVLHDEAKAMLDAYRAEVRAEALYEAADAIDNDNDDDCGCGGCDTCQPRKLATMLRDKAGEAEATPLIVSRYDTAMEPAPEEEPVFVVGAVAQDGRPVALLFDREARRKVAGWLAPHAAARDTAHDTHPEGTRQ